ncbi:hypothetical protein P3W43_10515 [Salinicola salarius]|uniref:hypothetical protein n=1 Tax=Salinicola salarius TaxID=430457 RepID=UPI0023E37A1C|nr:hypothetical protein [Salinicola salarius]MDF3919291.1 hypothetical protein [Salinicola salarius]
MILYKYVSHDADMKILQKGSVGFTQPCYFNDPFEVEASYTSTEGNNPIEVTLNGIRNWTKKEYLEGKYRRAFLNKAAAQSSHVGTLRKRAQRHGHWN